ncbi:MAG: hypothetical protein HYY06_19800 [Deltaproteobacteria bacterium]|nr:hypothetical protein [Deltaproteobacteria bacterium]
MSPVHVLLLGGQLILGAELSQAYNSAVIRDEAGDTHGGTMSVFGPRAHGRLTYDTSDYLLEYVGGFTFYDFDASDAELSHRGELRGHWQIGSTATADAFEQLTYGTDNTLRQMDVVRAASPEVSSQLTHYILNHGRIGYHFEIGDTTTFDAAASYLFRRTLDGVTTDNPIITFDSLSPQVELDLMRALNDDNQIGMRAVYSHFFSPTVPGGSFFDSPGRYALNGALVFTHRFVEWWSATAFAGGVYAMSLDPESDDNYVGPTLGASTEFRGPRLRATLRYEHTYGAYGVQAGSAVQDAGIVDLGFYPNPLDDDLNFQGAFDGRHAVEVLGDLGLTHDSLGATAGVRYEIGDYVSVYGQYEWRFQRLIGTPGGEDDLAIRRHIVTVGVAGQYAIPREIDVGRTDVFAE